VVDVVWMIGTVVGVTSELSDSGGVAGGGGMATVVAAGDWGVLSHPDTNQQPITIMAEAIQARGRADFVITDAPSGALTMRPLITTALITTVGTWRVLEIRAATGHFRAREGRSACQH
jgi:hypothetical protein